MKDIFEFNHIDKSLSESEIRTIKEFYKHYHKTYWCLKKSYKRFKLQDETITISGVCLVIIGTTTGGITLNPVLLSVVNGAGILVTNFGKMKNYKKKIEMTKIAFRTYEKVLVELRSALREHEFNKNEFIDKIKLIDEMIIDQTPLADKFMKNIIKILNKYIIKMIQRIIAYVYFNFPSYKDENYNDCFIKSCLVYKYLYDAY